MLCVFFRPQHNLQLTLVKTLLHGLHYEKKHSAYLPPVSAEWLFGALSNVSVFLVIEKLNKWISSNIWIVTLSRKALYYRYRTLKISDTTAWDFLYFLLVSTPFGVENHTLNTLWSKSTWKPASNGKIDHIKASKPSHKGFMKPKNSLMIPIVRPNIIFQYGRFFTSFGRLQVPQNPVKISAEPGIATASSADLTP